GRKCPFCSSKGERAAVIVYLTDDGTFTTSTCEECADSMSDEQTAEKLQQQDLLNDSVLSHNDVMTVLNFFRAVQAGEKPKRMMMSPQRGKAARKELSKLGVLIDSGKKLPSPKTGKLQIVWILNPELSEEQINALVERPKLH